MLDCRWMKFAYCTGREVSGSSGRYCDNILMDFISCSLFFLCWSTLFFIGVTGSGIDIGTDTGDLDSGTSASDVGAGTVTGVTLTVEWSANFTPEVLDFLTVLTGYKWPLWGYLHCLWGNHLRVWGGGMFTISHLPLWFIPHHQSQTSLPLMEHHCLYLWVWNPSSKTTCAPHQRSVQCVEIIYNIYKDSFV